MMEGDSLSTRYRSPTILPLKDKIPEHAMDGLQMYRETLPHERRGPLDRYHIEDIAMKVVGVGSVGTLCAVVLLMAEDDDPRCSR